MRASSGTFSDSFFPLTTVTANTSEKTNPPSPETSATFEDVFQQEGGAPSKPANLRGKAPNSTDNLPDQSTSSMAAVLNGKVQRPDPSTEIPVTSLVGATGEVTDETTPPANASVNGKSTALSDASDLSTMLVRAAVLASNAQQTPVAKATSNSPAISAVEPDNDSSFGATSAKDASPSISDISGLSTIFAQASILASIGQQILASTGSSATTAKTGAGLGEELPFLGLSKGGVESPTKEKKSASTSAEGSFLQSGTTSSYAISSPLGTVGSPLTSASESSEGQQLTLINGSSNLSSDDLSGSASGIAGTVNVEKEEVMNATLNSPEIFSGYGPNTVSQQAPVDLHIQLSTNNDFDNALKQVMHVAQLIQTNESRAPMRVAMEIQTPPGTIVNVYVSRQNDQWRAQLSTNDPQALSWVQDKMSSLRQSNDIGVEVRWLPPQMESASTRSSNDSGLAWDRGGQGHQGYQNQDERQQPGRQKKTELHPGIGSSQFMEALTAIRSAA